MSSAKTIQILLGFSISESVACVCGLGKKPYEWVSLYFSFSSCPFFFPLLSSHLSLLLISCYKSPLKSNHFFHICHLFYFIYFFVSDISVILYLSCSTLLVLFPTLLITKHISFPLIPSISSCLCFCFFVSQCLQPLVFISQSSKTFISIFKNICVDLNLYQVILRRINAPREVSYSDKQYLRSHGENRDLLHPVFSYQTVNSSKQG